MFTSLLAIALATLAADDDAQRGTWSFRHADRPVKVMLLAGSVGAYPGGNYGKQLEGVCKNIELKNLSKTGLGAFPLKQHFKRQVLENRGLDLDSTTSEHWLILGAGLNSIGMPKSTNFHLKNIMVLAHMAGIRVVALSPTPWGSSGSSSFAGVEGLRRRDATQLVTDFILGRLTPVDALGAHAGKRPAGADADWVALEVPDVAVDVYDSPLRDATAPLRDADKLRVALARDGEWNRAHAGLVEAQRAPVLEMDALRAAEVPRWFMRPELRAFDHIHPNAEGHRIIAETICPKLPATWGCTCP